MFDPPQYDKKTLYHIYNTNNSLLRKLESQISLNKPETEDLKQLPDTYLICFLNGFEEARERMEEARPILKKHDRQVYESLKESLRILRKVKYS